MEPKIETRSNRSQLSALNFEEVLNPLSTITFEQTAFAVMDELFDSPFHAHVIKNRNKGKKIAIENFRGIYTELHILTILQDLFPYSILGKQSLNAPQIFPMLSPRNSARRGDHRGSVVFEDLGSVDFNHDKYEADVLLGLPLPGTVKRSTVYPLVVQVKNTSPGSKDLGKFGDDKFKITYLSKLFWKYPRFGLLYCIPHDYIGTRQTNRQLEKLLASGGIVVRYPNDREFIAGIYNEYLSKL